MSVPDTIPKLITVKEAAALLRCSPNHVYAAKGRGDLPADLFTHALGPRSVRVYEAKLRRHIERRTEPARLPAAPYIVARRRTG